MPAAQGELPVQELIAIPFSPWSIASRWALLHLGVPHTTTSFAPPFGPAKAARRLEPRLPPGTKLTAPILVLPGGEPVLNAYAIATCAAEQAGDSGFTDGKEVGMWVERADLAMRAARAAFLAKWAEDEETMWLVLPGWMRALGPIGRWAGRQGMKDFADKYQNEGSGLGVHDLISVLQSLNARKGSYLVGSRFTYADLVIATVVESSAPADGYLVESGLRRFARENTVPVSSELVEWKDWIFAEHFPAEIKGKDIV